MAKDRLPLGDRRHSPAGVIPQEHGILQEHGPGETGQDRDLVQQVDVEFDRYLQMREAVRRESARRRRSVLRQQLN